MLWTGGWLIEGACGMGAVSLGANTGYGMGRALGWVGSVLCCWVLELGGAGLIVFGKGGRVAFGARGTKYFVVGSNFVGPNYSRADLMFQVPWIVKFEIVRWEITRMQFLIYLRCERLSWNGLLNGQWTSPLGVYRRRWLSAAPWLLMLGSAMPCWPVWSICVLVKKPVC